MTDSAPTSRSRRGAVSATVAIALGLASFTALPASAAPPTQTIAAVQGTGDTSPFIDTVQTIEGVVTADYRTGGYGGIAVQTAGSGGTDDATPGASDGIFVFLRGIAVDVELGDLVQVTGTVSERAGQTQLSLTDSDGFAVVTEAEDVPADVVPQPTELPDTLVGDAREALESQLVSPTGTYRVASTFQLSSFGTLWLSPGADRPVTATETTDAGEAATAIDAANRAARLLLDDGYNARVTSADHVGEQPYFSADEVVRSGDTVEFPATPYVLAFGFGDWRLQPVVPITDTSPADLRAEFTATNPRPDAVPAVGGDSRLASFNVFNYFTTLAGDNPEARGAETAEQFALQRDKIIAAINGLGADVVALSEIENSIRFGQPVDTALADLVDGLNDAAGADTWAFVPTPDVLAGEDAAAITDVITNAIIYRTAGASRVGDSFTAVDETVWDIAREPIAQTFDIDGEIVTVVANHFKSKGGGTGAEPADGQGFFNAERVEQAAAVVDLVEGVVADPTKGANVALLGDFNAYAEEDPIQLFTEAGFIDVLPARAAGQYTYEFDGELGSLDHALVTADLAAAITGAGVWSINSPEWSERGYFGSAAEPGTPFRSSDHDPIVVGLSATPLPVDIDIVTTNDFHGRLEASGGVAGAAVLGGMVRAYEKANPNTLFVGAGDLIGASTFTSFIQNDQPTIDAFNAIGLDASALGNHEFDTGTADLNNRIIPAADWPYLSANVYKVGTTEAAYQEFEVREFRGVRVGFIGAVTEELPSLVSPAGIEDITVGPIVPAVNRVATQLSDGDESNGEADVLMLLVHEGAASTSVESATDNSAFGQIVNEVDPSVSAIISAHTHLAYNHEVPIPGSNQTRIVLSAGQYGENFGHLDLVVDPDTHDVLSLTAEVKPLASAFAPNPRVAQIVADAVAVAAVEGSVPLGEITGDFNRARQSDGLAENRGGESPLGNFVADVQLWSTQSAGTEIALMNPGGLRADLTVAANPATPGDADGVVTFQEAAGVQPFANTLFAVDLTTEQLDAVLEEQWQPEGASRPFLKLGTSENLDYVYDPTAQAGSRVSSIYVSGVLAAPGDTFRVAVNSFLASGGDNFLTLAEGTNRTDTGKVDLQSMVDYFEAFPSNAPSFQQRSFGVVLSPMPEGGYAAGDEVTVALSSLLMSGNGPTAGTAVLSLGDTELGRAALDATVIDASDEVGRASITFTIPAGVTGPQQLTLTVPETSSSVAVPIVVADAAESLTVITPPTITGKARVGRTLTADGGTWSAENTTFAFQWMRNGAPIDGATNAEYVLTTADAATTVTVKVTASAEGFADGTAEAKAVTVHKVNARFYGAANPVLSLGGAGIEYTGIALAPGFEPTGRVVVYDNGAKVASGTIVAGNDGRVTIALPTLTPGVHLLTARYGGTEQITGYTAFPALVIVF